MTINFKQSFCVSNGDSGAGKCAEPFVRVREGISLSRLYGCINKEKLLRQVGAWRKGVWARTDEKKLAGVELVLAKNPAEVVYI